MKSGLGADIAIESGIRPSALLFGESTGRAIVTFDPKAESAVRASAEQSRVPFAVVGRVAGDRLKISLQGRTLVDEQVSALRDLWSTAFAHSLESADVL